MLPGERGQRRHAEDEISLVILWDRVAFFVGENLGIFLVKEVAMLAVHLIDRRFERALNQGLGPTGYLFMRIEDFLDPGCAGPGRSAHEEECFFLDGENLVQAIEEGSLALGLRRTRTLEIAHSIL